MSVAGDEFESQRQGVASKYQASREAALATGLDAGTELPAGLAIIAGPPEQDL